MELSKIVPLHSEPQFTGQKSQGCLETNQAYAQAIAALQQARQQGEQTPVGEPQGSAGEANQ